MEENQLYSTIVHIEVKDNGRAGLHQDYKELFFLTLY